MLSFIQSIPNINTYPLKYVFEHMKLQHMPNTLWLEFGVGSGDTINYISKFTDGKIYGFDSFEGLPQVNSNVELINGSLNETLLNFIERQNQKISFIHIKTDLYSSTKYIFDVLKDHIAADCIIIFDKFVNYPVPIEPVETDETSEPIEPVETDETSEPIEPVETDETSEPIEPVETVKYSGELNAFYEFITENKVDYEWIGMNGRPTGMSGYYNENVALIIRSINIE
jgi:hypothetical protein